MVSFQFVRAAAFAVLSSCLLLGLSSTQVQGEDQRYYILGDPMPGTKFRQKIFSSNIPLDKPYNELSEKQKAFVRADYEGMPVSEIPPYPKKGRGALISPLVKAHSRVLKNGELIAIAMVGTDGKVEQVELFSAPTEELGEFVIALLFNTPFDAASCNDEPCAMEFLLELDMRVKAGNF